MSKRFSSVITGLTLRQVVLVGVLGQALRDGLAGVVHGEAQAHLVRRLGGGEPTGSVWSSSKMKNTKRDGLCHHVTVRVRVWVRIGRSRFGLDVLG